jgi:hypothetical protein
MYQRYVTQGSLGYRVILFWRIHFNEFAVGDYGTYAFAAEDSENTEQRNKTI